MFCCALCRSSEIDEVNYGEVLGEELQVHTFCLYLSSNLCQSGHEDEGLLGFLLDDIIKESKRISKLYCCYCSKSYANIGCCNTKCRRTFHLICGIKNGAENQFVDTYNSYCNLHVRKHTGQVPNRDVNCCICYENLRKPLKKFDAVQMLLAPCCQNGWFHKTCLQNFAKTAGYFFKCPLCNDSEIFCELLPYRGVFIYNRDAAWELEPNAFADQLVRPNSCAANKCKCYHGRQKNTTRNPLLLCMGCGSIAMHKHCLPDLIRSNKFYCNDCNIFQEINCKSLRSKYRNESYDEDDDVDVCNDSDENDSLETSKTTIIIASSNEEIIFREGGVQRINIICDDDSDDELTACLNKPWIARRNKNINKILDDDSDVENDSKVEIANINHSYADNESNRKECIADRYDKAHSSNSNIPSLSLYNIRSNSLENSHIPTEDKHINIAISSDDDDCLPIKESSTVSKRRKIFDEPINITDDSNYSSDDFPNFQPDKLCDNKPISVTATVKPRKKSLQNITNDLGSCNSISMNTSCIANRTRRKSIYIDSDSVNTVLSSVSPKRRTKSPVRTSIKTEKSSQSISNNVSRSSINSSCIANRTRRKSIYKESDTVKNAVVSSLPTSGRVDSMTTLCIAQRTRRKSICNQIQSTNEPSERYETNLIYPNKMQSEPCVNQSPIRTEKINTFSHDRHNSDMNPLNATSTERRYVTPSKADVKDKISIQTVVTSSDVSSDSQFQSLSGSSSISSYKSLYSSMENGTSKSPKSSNACIKKNRVKVLVKRVRNSSALRPSSSKYGRLLSTDNENCVKSQPKGNASENRLQRNFRIKNSKCPMRAKHYNIIPYLTPGFQRNDGLLKEENTCNVIELFD